MMAHPAHHHASRAPLRRATYIHVSDLTSAYNIDHRKLEQELTRVQKEDSSATHPDEEGSEGLPLGETGQDGDVSMASSHHHQKRLQPPRGGSNLCV